jgi:hypothetical protein
MMVRPGGEPGPVGANKFPVTANPEGHHVGAVSHAR